jgi:DNA-binding Lrp family transcriptional regulator
MTELNAVGDLVLTEPRAMLALADASRLTLHDALHRGGPATAGDLASRLGSQLPEILRRLETLEDAGLVERSEPKASNTQTVWSAVGKGIFFEIPEDTEGQSAARALSNTMFLQYVDLPRSWVSNDEPRLSLEWARAAGLLNVRLLVTSDELRDIQSVFEGVLEPYLTRRPDDAPSGASRVRLLSYFMPELPQRD